MNTGIPTSEEWSKHYKEYPEKYRKAQQDIKIKEKEKCMLCEATNLAFEKAFNEIEESRKLRESETSQE